MAALRILGIGVILAALAAAVFDATRPGDAWGVTATSIGEVWHWLDAGSLEATKNMMQRHAPNIWDPWLLKLLQ